MGPKISKSKSRKPIPGSFPFEQRLKYYDDIMATVENFKAIQFRGPLMNTEQLPKDILRVIFLAGPSIAFYGNIARVCQLWYQVSTWEDVLWEQFLNQPLEHSDYSAKIEVYLQWRREAVVCVPSCFKKKILAGYRIPIRDERNCSKIVVLGFGGVGKSALTLQFVQGYFVEKHEPWIEDSYSIQRRFHKQDVHLEVLDTAGTEQFTAMRDLYMKNGTAFVVLYSIISKATFNDLPDLLHQIYRVNSMEPMKPQFQKPIIIVGNKVDLSDQRLVSYKEGSDLAQKWHAGFVETSAKANINVDAVFRVLAELLMSFATANANAG